MTKTLLDTNIIISLLNDEDGIDELLGKLSQEGGLFINSVIYAELSVYMEKEKLDEFLEDTNIKMEDIGKEASSLAGEKFSHYIDHQEEGLQCSECGEINKIRCSECEKKLDKRQYMAPDFLIASHAKKQADRLATLDKGFHSRYFKDLTMTRPE